MTIPVLILPGYACTSQIWEPVLPLLSPEIQPTLVDWPINSTPAFNQIADFAGWLADHFPIQSYAAIIGHSLGGLVALQLLADHPGFQPTLILVESFPRSPEPFFQNMLMANAGTEIFKTVNLMLQTQGLFYSSDLRMALRDLDLTPQVHRLGGPMFALYGDRGLPDHVLQALNWPDDLRAKIPVTVIPHSCHFPMLESPKPVADTLNGLIGE